MESTSRMVGGNGNARGEPEIAVVLPVYEGARHLAQALKRLVTFGADHKNQVEVIVVDDASSDRSGEIAARWQEHLDSLTVLRHNSPRGLGAAARSGVLVARAKRILFTDAELSVEPTEFETLLAALDEGHEVAIASRRMEGAEHLGRSTFTQRMSIAAVDLVTRFLVRPGVSDASSGVHAWLRGAARSIAERSSCDGPLYMAEWIAIARRVNLSVVERPVRWTTPGTALARTSFLHLCELARAGRRLSGADYVAPLPDRATLADTSFVRFDAARAASDRKQARLVP